MQLRCWQTSVIAPPMMMHDHSPAIRRWLLACMALVVLMVGLGGYTRLTESGLSIVEWKLLSGTLPPMNAKSWAHEFAEYQTSPQFKKVNAGFTVADFKKIYWLEYLHRLLGRIIGMLVILPFFYFLARGKLSPAMKRRGLLLTFLVASQGAVGWIMVASGLVDAPRVAPIKLALHLSLAFVFFLSMLWTYWQLHSPARSTASAGLSRAAKGLFLLIFLQIVFGALVAGLDAGLSYNTYPLMDGQFIPNGLHALSPWWKNHLESVLTVQFQHRMGALAVVTGVIGFVMAAWKRGDAAQRHALQWLAAAVALQFALGVATLLSAVNIHLASAHQLVALLLLGSTLRITYLFRQD